MPDPAHPAWLEGAEGLITPVAGACFIGRAPANQLVLNDERVSRRHAAIHQQGGNEFWLADLGSRNGVTLNGRRIVQSTRLSDSDQIQIGQFRFVFRHPAGTPPEAAEGSTVNKTLSDVRPSDCWLLVLDIEASTHLSQKVSPEELPALTGRWLEQCKKAIDAEGGSIDKYLGDGILAFWRHSAEADEAVLRVLAELKRIRAEGPLAFRSVLHFGRVFSGGAAASGLERFFGPEINFVFKMESLAKSLRVPHLASQPAWDKMRRQGSFRELGEHSVPGFDGQFSFFAF